MAKNTLPGLRKALKVVDTLGAQMTREGNADYRVALSALGAGQANLSKQTRRLTRDLLAGDLKATQSLNVLAKQAQRQKGEVANRTAAVTNRYGTGLGASVARSFSGAKTAARGTAAIGGAAARAGQVGTRVAQTVAATTAAGVEAQKQAAKYGLTQALQQRAIIDNQTLAAMTGQLYETALQYNMQMEMYERQKDDALKQMKAEMRLQSRFASKEQGEQLAAQVGNLMEQGPTVAAAANEALAEWLRANEGADVAQAPIGDLIEQYRTQMGYQGTESEMGLFAATLRNIAAGQDPGLAYSNSVKTLFGGLPGWERYGAPLIGATSSLYNAQTLGTYANVLADVQGTDPALTETGGQSFMEWYTSRFPYTTSTPSGGFAWGGLFGQLAV